MHIWLHIWQHNYFPFFSKFFIEIIFILSYYFFCLFRLCTVIISFLNSSKTVLNILITSHVALLNFLFYHIKNIFQTFFDLINFIYEPYQEPNDNPVYINKNSNHAHTVLQQLAKSVSKRISQTSSNEHIFKESGLICEEALKKSGFYQKPEYLRK